MDIAKYKGEEQNGMEGFVRISSDSAYRLHL